MPITIKPSKSLDICLDTAEDGDMIVAVLENRQKLFLKYVADQGGKEPEGHFTFDERWMPPDLVALCDATVPSLLQRANYSQVFEAREDRSERLGALLSRKLRSGLWVQAMKPGQSMSGMIDVGLSPYTYLSADLGGIANQIGATLPRWEAQAPIASIAVATEYAAEVYCEVTRLATARA